MRIGALAWEDPGDTVTLESPRGSWFGAKRPGPIIDLPFAFPFSGRTWTRAYVNVFGNISFTGPESQHWPQRGERNSEAMRSMAAAIDSRSAAGLEAMIAVLWAPYGRTAISLIPRRSEWLLPGGLFAQALVPGSTSRSARTCSKCDSTRRALSIWPTKRWRRETASSACSMASRRGAGQWTLSRTRSETSTTTLWTSPRSSSSTMAARCWQ